jgi:predicted KAP-like P-loop ATPase
MTSAPRTLGDSVRLVSGDLIPDRVVRAREEDAFRHQAIAARVADLVTTAEPPFNVALFGPWGSGKSSLAELLREELSERASTTAFVVYDAWKYSGDALKRSFVTEVASSLGVGDDIAVTTLSQEVERNQLDLKQVDKRQLQALRPFG